MKYSPEDVLKFDKQISELKELGLIRNSNSPHSSPAFMVRNHSEIKRGKARLVINYKQLNEKTIFDGYFLPHKETLVNQNRGKKIFSKFDCKSGFWQIKLTKESIPNTAFIAPQGHYEWVFMPFGLKNAPQIFQRRMDGIFKSYCKFITVYIDDILISSYTEEEHEKHLEIFKLKCLENGLSLSQKKAELRKNNIDFLGFNLDGQGIELQNHILEKIKNFPDEIKDIKQMQRFLGCLNYAEQFIENLAEQRAPLQKMLREGNSINPSDTRKIISHIKVNCATLPRQTSPDSNDDLVLNTTTGEQY